MTMQSPQYTSPFVQFKLTKPSVNLPPTKVEKPQHDMKYNPTPHMFVNNPLQSNIPIATNPPLEKKKKQTKRTSSPPLANNSSQQQQQPTQSAYIHWKFNESFDNAPQQSNTALNSTKTNSKRNKKVKYGCLAFSLSDCTLVNNVNYQRPHHNSNNNWSPASNNQFSCTQNLPIRSISPIDSRESSNFNQLHGVLNSTNHSLHNTTQNMDKESQLTVHDTSLSPNQATGKVIRTTISIKDILN